MFSIGGGRRGGGVSFLLLSKCILQLRFSKVPLADCKITEGLKLEGRSSGPTALLKEGHLKAIAQDHVHMVFDHLQAQRSHKLWDNLYQCLVTLRAKKGVS